MQNVIFNTILNLNKFAAGCTSGATVQAGSDTFDTCLPTINATSSVAAMVVRLVFGVIGAIAVIYIMYAAFRFVRSQGEPKEIAQARQTIIYAVLGLAIAVLAEAIVSFALGRL